MITSCLSITCTVLLLWCLLIVSDGQNCANNPNISTPGDYFILEGIQFVMPNLTSNCNGGRISGVTANMYAARRFGSLPVFQVWHPLSPGSNVYSKVGQVQFEAPEGANIVTRIHISNVSLTGSDRIEFQSGDVIGCYQPFFSRYTVGANNASYTSYFTNSSSLAATTINVNNVSYFETIMQPLINVMIDVRCGDLSLPANGMMSCSSGRVGVGYEGDTCSFTCNTDYELTGSDTRTCQSDGSWSGTDVMCRRVSCLSLSDPNNGIISCSLGDDGVPSYEDTCSFTCNTGYELTGSDTRTCQSDGNWSGSDVVCRRSRAVDVGNNGSTFQDSQISDDGSGSSGAVIGGAVGGILFIIIVIIAVLVVIFYTRLLHRRKEHSFEDAKNSKSIGVHDYQNMNNETYEQSVVITPSSKVIYEKSDSRYYSILNTALSSMNGAHDEPQYEASVDWYAVSSPPSQELVEREEEIYNTSYEDERNYGPVYCEPPLDEQTIYAEFEGKRFCKLYHKEIWSFEELGTGEFGVVTHCKWKPSTNKEVEVAVKTLNSNASDKDRLKFLQEAAIMCQFDHQNVIKLHGVVTETPAMIVLEYMKHGDLKNVLMQLQPMNGITAHSKLPLILLKFCNEIAAGMTYLSGKQFVHRDLAARNILVSDKIVCKIADFGMSRDLIDGNYYITSGGKIPVKWTAPEAIHYKKYSVQSDVWSYGCIMYEIWSLGYKPFEELTNLEVIEKVDYGFRLPPPPGCPRTIYRIMTKCWHPDPRSRPQFGQITKLLTGNSGYLLRWSDEDKQIGGEDAMKLGAPLESANNLYYDLQMQYKQISI